MENIIPLISNAIEGVDINDSQGSLLLVLIQSNLCISGEALVQKFLNL